MTKNLLVRTIIDKTLGNPKLRYPVKSGSTGKVWYLLLRAF